MSERIQPDEFFPIHVEGREDPFLVNAKYDRVDHWKPVGQWVLKIFDDEDGFVTLFVDEETAQTVIEHAELPVVVRETIFESELEAYCRMQSQDIDTELDNLE